MQKVLLNCKQEKNMFKQNVFLIRFYYIFILQGYDGTLLHQRRSEAAGVLENFAKFTAKHLCWSHVLIKLHT